MHQISIWERESFYSEKDILIAGSGFVGLWAAYYLLKKNPKLRIGILERGSIPTGASTRNAGFSCFGSVTELMADSQAMGEAAMLELVDMRFRGLRRIRKVFSNKDIGYEASGGYELITPSPRHDFNRLRSDMDWLNRKLRPITKKNKTFQLSDAKALRFGLAGVDHLIENRLEGQLHSGKFCQSLLRLVQSMGVTVLNNVEITGIEQDGHRVRLNTANNLSLVSSQLLICTNAFARQLVPALNVEPARGQVLVTGPIPGLPLRGCFHYDEGFYYFRNLGNRILLGGARNKAMEEEHTDSMTVSDKIQRELERFLQEVVIPGQPYTIEHRWSGIMGVGDQKMPIVQQLGEGVFCAVRMSGMGVALAPEIGRRVSVMMGHH